MEMACARDETWAYGPRHWPGERSPCKPRSRRRLRRLLFDRSRPGGRDGDRRLRGIRRFLPCFRKLYVVSGTHAGIVHATVAAGKYGDQFSWTCESPCRRRGDVWITAIARIGVRDIETLRWAICEAALPWAAPQRQDGRLNSGRSTSRRHGPARPRRATGAGRRPASAFPCGPGSRSPGSVRR